MLKKFLSYNSVELIIFVFFFALYGITSARTIVQGDTGDFLSAAAIGGIPHPTGYPLYTLLARIVYLLPLGNPTWQVHLLSVLFGSLALVVVYKIVFALTQNRTAGILSTLSLGIFETFWFYSLVSQIHILQVFILASLFYCLIQFNQTNKNGYLIGGALLFGLGMSNNMTTVFSIPAILIILIVHRKKIPWKLYAKFLGAFSLGLLPYLYIWYAASQNAPISWGGVHDFKSFFNLITRGDYGSLQWANPEPWAPFKYSTFVFYWKYLFDTSWFLLPFPFLLYFYWRKNPLVSFILVISFLIFGPLFYLWLHTYVRNVIYQANATQYYPYSYLFFSILLGLGFFGLAQKYKFQNNKYLFVAILILFLPLFIYNFPRVRQDTTKIAEITTRFELDELPKNAIVITSGDSISFPGRYWHFVKQYRPDVLIIDGGLYTFAWYREMLKEHYPELYVSQSSKQIPFDAWCKQFADSGRLFVSPWYPDFDIYFEKNCKVIPYGLVAQVVPKKSPFSIEKIKRFNDSEWVKYTKLIDPTKNKNDYLRTRETLFYLAEQLNYTGIYYVRNKKLDWAENEFIKARTVSQDESNALIGESAILYQRNEFEKGISLLEQGIVNNPTQLELYKNIALFYEKLGNKDKMYSYFKTYLEFKPVTDPNLPGIITFIRSYESSKMLQSSQ